MKIINRKEFLQMPNSTLFMKASPEFGDFDMCFPAGELMIKEESLSNDFVYSDFVDIDCSHSDEFFYKIAAMRNEKLDIPVSCNETSRDGIFDDSELYIVFSKEDIKTMVEKLMECYQAFDLHYPNNTI